MVPSKHTLNTEPTYYKHSDSTDNVRGLHMEIDDVISGKPCLVGAYSKCSLNVDPCTHVIAVVLDWIVPFVPKIHTIHL